MLEVVVSCRSGELEGVQLEVVQLALVQLEVVQLEVVEVQLALVQLVASPYPLPRCCVFSSQASLLMELA